MWKSPGDPLQKCEKSYRSWSRCNNTDFTKQRRERRSFTVLLHNTRIYEYTHFRTNVKQNNSRKRQENRGQAQGFDLVYLFSSVAISITNTIIPETESFASKLIHHEEIFKSSPDNLPNFTNPLDLSKEAGNDNFTFNESTSQPDRMNLVEATRK